MWPPMRHGPSFEHICRIFSERQINKLNYPFNHPLIFNHGFFKYDRLSKQILRPIRDHAHGIAISDRA